MWPASISKSIAAMPAFRACSKTAVTSAVTTTALPAIRRDVKLLEPSDRTAVLGAQNRGDIGNTNNSATIPCQHEETAPHVCDRNLQYAGQGIWRRLDAMLSELVD